MPAFLPALLLGALASAQDGSTAAAPAPRLVLLYATCTLNRAYLAPYGGDPALAPRVAAFAREGAVLANHLTEEGLSGTAFASLLAGVQADRHGVFKHPQELSDELELVFESFARAGWETHYWAGHGMASPRYGYAQGVLPKHRRKERLDGNDREVERLLAALAADPSRRAFLATTFTLTHSPYELEGVDELLAEAPERARGLSRAEIDELHALYVAHCRDLQTRYAETVAELGLTPERVERLAAVIELAYEAGVRRLDRHFGRVLDALARHGLADVTAVAFTADHGETLQREHRLFPWTHSPELAPEVVHVPLLIRGPGVAPARVAAVTRSIDVFPTLAGLAGVAVPAEAIQGVDLSRALRGQAPFPALTAYVHGTLRQWSFFTPDVIENVRVGKKEGDAYFRARLEGDEWRFELFDLASAEPERDRFDLADERHRAAAAELWEYRRRLIEAYRRFHPDEATSREEELERLGEEERRALSALGYIGDDDGDDGED